MIVYIKKDAIIDLSYSLSKNIQYKRIWILFEVGCLHQHTAIALYRLDRNGKLLQFFRILITAVYFKDQKWISKTVHCISCFMVCQKTFCSKFSNIPGKAGRATRIFRTLLKQVIICQCFFSSHHCTFNSSSKSLLFLRPNFSQKLSRIMS